MSEDQIEPNLIRDSYLVNEVLENNKREIQSSKKVLFKIIKNISINFYYIGYERNFNLFILNPVNKIIMWVFITLQAKHLDALYHQIFSNLFILK